MRAAFGIALLSGLLATGAFAQRSEAAPEELEGVEITEKLGTTIPLDLTFKNERGETVRLRDYFESGRPVAFTFNYARCPMLCKLQLEGLVDSLKQFEWKLGQEFDLITVSIDPEETSERARLSKRRYLELLGDETAAVGWHFVTDVDGSVKQLAEALGFGYRYVPETNEYAHTAVLMLTSPTGVVSRYLYGVRFAPSTMRLGLVEAGEGKVGNTLDRFLLFCFQYDSKAGQYTPAIYTLMRAGGLLTVIALAIVIFGVRRSRRRVEVPLGGAA